jgi:hypothetical protein
MLKTFRASQNIPCYLLREMPIARQTLSELSLLSLNRHFARKGQSFTQVQWVKVRALKGSFE